MTVPEENRPTTETTDDLLDHKDDHHPRTPGGTGRTMREALEEAEVRPGDFDDR
ncbi:hypothetical protein ACWGBH_26915 [Streptomyces massasporeus]